MTKTEIIAALLRMYGRPLRPFLEEATNVTAGKTDPADAWDAALLTGVLPSDFGQAGKRSFSSRIEAGRPPDFPHVPTLRHPPSIQAVMAVTSNPSGILAAEQYAQAFAQRLAPWGLVSSGTIVWNFTSHAIDYVGYLCAAYEFAMDTLDDSLDQQGVTLSTLEPSKRDCPLPIVVRRCVAAWEGWQLATEREWNIAGRSWPLDLTQWRVFTQLASPFEVLINLWLTGYQIYSDFNEHDSATRLFAPLQKMVGQLAL